MRFAALPVGAHMSTLSPCCSKSEIIALRVVVLPVPGPPVSTIKPFERAVFIASRCLLS